MSRICDDSFEGGQMAGIVYHANVAGIDGYRQIRLDRIDRNDADGGGGYRGPITGVSGLYLDYSIGGWQGWYQDIYHAYGNPSKLRVSPSVDGNPAWSIPLGIINFFRRDGLLDTGGNPKKICRCEPTDQTIQCLGQEGDICCIPKAVINELCERLK